VSSELDIECLERISFGIETKMESGKRPYIEKVHFKVSDQVTNLKIGAPGPDLLAKSREVIKRGSQERFDRSDDLELFNYGVEEGPTSFIYNLSKLLTNGYQDNVPMEDLMLTPGASAGLFFAVSILTDTSKCKVFVESPTYFLVLRVLADLGINSDRIVPVPVDSDGMDVDYLQRQLVTVKPDPARACGKYCSFVYTIPTYHNPTGVCLSPHKSVKLIQLSRRFNFLIICDDVYNLLYYNDSAPKRLVAYDKEITGQRSVVSNGSFSKILAPGIRLGWFETSPSIKARLTGCGVVDSGGSLNAVAAGIVASSIEMGLLQQNLESLRSTYKNRMNAVVEVLRKGLPDSFEVRNPQGGYFVWVTGPDGFDAKCFGQLCASQYGVEFLHGEVCSSLIHDGIQASTASKDLVDKMSSRNNFRISIAFYPEQVLCTAAQRICQAANCI